MILEWVTGKWADIGPSEPDTAHIYHPWPIRNGSRSNS